MEHGDLEALEPCAPAAETGQQWAQTVDPGDLMPLTVEVGVQMEHGDLEASEPCDQVAKPQEPRAQAVELGALMAHGDLEALEPCAPAAEQGNSGLRQWILGI